MTAVDIDISILQALDFEIEEPCECGNCKHGQPRATHFISVTGTCHPYDRICCEGCAKDMARIRQLVENDNEFGCPVCHEGCPDASILITTLEGN